MTALLEVLPIGLRFISAWDVEQNLQAVVKKKLSPQSSLKTGSFQCGAVDICDSFNLFGSSFVSFSINGLKENAKNLNYYSILRRKVSRALFVSPNSPWMRKFSSSLLANAVNSGCDQGERCLSPKFFALLTCWHVQFSKIFAFIFPP